MSSIHTGTINNILSLEILYGKILLGLRQYARELFKSNTGFLYRFYICFFLCGIIIIVYKWSNDIFCKSFYSRSSQSQIKRLFMVEQQKVSGCSNIIITHRDIERYRRHIYMLNTKYVYMYTVGILNMMNFWKGSLLFLYSDYIIHTTQAIDIIVIISIKGFFSWFEFVLNF